MRWLHSIIITVPGGILMLIGRPHCAIYPYYSYTVCMSLTEGKARAFQAQIALIHDEQMLRADSVIGTRSPEPEYNVMINVPILRLPLRSSKRVMIN
jgi:hypothetical protein